jgi:hypothetical protein
MSIASATMGGPAAAAPSRATSSGTPMKPEFGNAATSAPNDASFDPVAPRCVVAIVIATITSAQSRWVIDTPGPSSRTARALRKCSRMASLVSRRAGAEEISSLPKA